MDSDTNLVVFLAPYAEWHSEIHAIRNDVFVREQGVPVELEMDGLDERAMHVVLVVDGRAVGTGRLLEDGRIGRIAVLAEYRGRGYGARVTHCLIGEARRRGIRMVSLHAQTRALRFYEKLGFLPEGQAFLEAGIEHLNMQLVLR